MKTPPSSNRTRFFSLVRITSASVLLTAAAAMAFVAAKPSGPLWAKSGSKDAVNKFNQNRVQLFRNKLAMPGPEREGGPTWTFVSGSFATNAIGTLTFDAANNTLYAGTGEPNSSGDSEAGFGIYKSTDAGNTWTHLAANTSVPAGAGVDCTCAIGFGGFRIAPAYSGPAFDGRSISSIVVDPGNANILYVSSDRGVRGISSETGGTVSLAPGLPP